MDRSILYGLEGPDVNRAAFVIGNTCQHCTLPSCTVPCLELVAVHTHMHLLYLPTVFMYWIAKW